MAKDTGFSLASLLSSLNPNISSDVIRGAQFFTDTSGMEKYFKKKTKSEKALEARLKNLKSDEKIAAEQRAAFDIVRNVSNAATQSAPAVSSALTSGLSGALSGLQSFAGTNVGALTNLANAAMSAEAPSMVAATDLRNVGLAGTTQAALAEQAGIATAKGLRDEARTKAEDLLAEFQDTRMSSLMALRGDKRTNLLKYISSLVGLKPSSSGNGSSSSTTTSTDPTNTDRIATEKDILKYIMKGDTGSYLPVKLSPSEQKATGMESGSLRPGYYGASRPAPRR